MTIWTVSDQIYYAYANLAMAYDAVSKGLIKYDRICFMIRSRLYKGLQKGDMKIHSLLDDEKTQVAKWHQMCLLRRRYRDLDRPYDSTNKGRHRYFRQSCLRMQNVQQFKRKEGPHGMV